MNPETCAVLASVFPLMLIAVVADRRLLHMRLRQRKLYRGMFVTTLAACLLGLIYSVVGVQLDGFTQPYSFFMWLLFGTALLAFAFSILLHAVTSEIEEEDALERDRLTEIPQVF